MGAELCDYEACCMGPAGSEGGALEAGVNVRFRGTQEVPFVYVPT